MKRLLGVVLAVSLLMAITPLSGVAGNASPPRALIPRTAPTKPAHTTVSANERSGYVHLKFQEGTAVRLRGQRFVSLADDDLDAVNAVLKSQPGIHLSRLFNARTEPDQAAEKLLLETRSHRELADKNLYYRIRMAKDADASSLVDALNALPIVEIAYPEPLPPPPPTPDFTASQGYTLAAPDGIGIGYARTVPGGRGENVTILDIEYSWNWNHEDLSKARAQGAFVANGTLEDPFADNNHGTAVLGELIADDNRLGVTGLIPDATLRMVNVNSEEDDYDLPDSISIGTVLLGPGDVMLIEQQSIDLEPIEWIPAHYDAITAAVADGIIVVEPAGNGSHNLDAEYYGSPFPDGKANSGAIIVGAGGAARGGDAPPMARMDYSTGGSRCDLQGWGEQVVTTGYGELQGTADPNEAYTDVFGGTSGAAPIVAAAAAVLSSVAKEQGDWNGLNSIEAREYLKSTGTPQNTGPGTLAGNIGPLPNLEAALAMWVPHAEAGGPYLTPEGTNVTVSAADSWDLQGGALTYQWDLDNDGYYDDATGLTATFSAVGQDGPKKVGLKVTDPSGATDTDTAVITVNEVLPTLSATFDSLTVDEGSTLSLTGTAHDPGWLDELPILINWGDGRPLEDPGGIVENVRPDATRTFAASHVYGDNGDFLVQPSAQDDGGASGRAYGVTIRNVAPTADINEGGTIDVNRVPTFFAHAGELMTFRARSIDPGSDDLDLSWVWGEGSPSTGMTTSYLVNPPATDPFPSPTIKARHVIDTQQHAFAGVNVYSVAFKAVDDDGGRSSDGVHTVILGNAPLASGAGYWRHQLLGDGAMSAEQLSSYLKVVGYMSAFFDESRDASTPSQASAVITGPPRFGDVTVMFDQQLLAVWLNFANGSIHYLKMIDTDGDNVDDTTFAKFVSRAEALRMNPATTRAQLLNAKNLLEEINTGAE